VARSVLFEKEPVVGLSGLAGLTAPGPHDGVSRVADVVVLGAKGDGKTQLITHAIRTLDARPATGLSPDEQLQTEKILQLVLNAKRPQPEANPDKKVRHYVFRVRPEILYGGLGAFARLAVLLRAGLVGGHLAAVTLSTLIVLGALRGLRGAFDLATLTGALLALGLGALWALRGARRTFADGGDVELVFWDVAGEDVYSDRGASNYHAFLSALAARRRADRRDGSYALAPVLICNPLALGKSRSDSPYARLRMIVPTFAALHGQPDVLTVVNRSRLAAAVCDGDRPADELCAVLPVARDAVDPGDAVGGAARSAAGGATRRWCSRTATTRSPKPPARSASRPSATTPASTPRPARSRGRASRRCRRRRAPAGASRASSRRVSSSIVTPRGRARSPAMRRPASSPGSRARSGRPDSRFAPVREVAQEPAEPAATAEGTVKMYATALAAEGEEQKRGGFRSGT
jgi:hypothetical protein